MIIFKIEPTGRETMIHSSCADYFNKATFAHVYTTQEFKSFIRQYNRP